MLITLATPTVEEPTRNAVTYWEVLEGPPPPGDDPLDALTVRLAAAYEQPGLLAFHLGDVGSAAGRAARLADPAVCVETKGQVLTVADYLSAYVLEWTLHHLDLVAHLPGVPGPAAEGLAHSRSLLADLSGADLPPRFDDADALLLVTGRRAAEGAETQALARRPRSARRLPLALG